MGATPQLTTSVWVGDPDAYTPMVSIPAFLERGVSKVQGGLFPAEIWKTYMNPAHAFLPVEDWEAPPPAARANARLVLPGTECVLEIVGYEAAAVPEEEEAPPAEPSGFRAPAQPEPPAEPPPAEPEPEEPVATAPPVPIYAPVQVGTTIDPAIVDPTHPLPTIPAGQAVGPCF